MFMNSTKDTFENVTPHFGNTVLCTVISFLDWKEQQHKSIRGGKVMYDVKGHYKYLYEHELFEYWSKYNCA